MIKKYTKFLVLFLVAIFLFIFIILYYYKDTKQSLNYETNQNTIPSIALTNEYKTTDFYYNQLNAIEQSVYNQLVERLNDYKGGEIVLQESISVNNLSRIADAIRFNDNNNYFYLLFALPLTNTNKVVNWGTNQPLDELEKKQIDKILLLLYLGEDDRRIDNLELSDDNTIVNFNELKNIFEVIPNELVEKYEKIKKDSNAIIDDIIVNMPKDLSQEEAVEYFGNWIINNLSYTESYNLGINYGDIVNDEVQLSTSLASITNKSAICSGFAMILSELCRRVGIESYICLGTLSDGGIPSNHAWVAIVLGDTTYYKDPTKDVSFKKLFPLKIKEDLDKGTYLLRFSKHFDF